MRLVFVNHLHPATGLVGSVRLWRFAEELARQGHSVIFLCGTAEEAGSPSDPADLPNRLRDHVWATPLILSCGPVVTKQSRGSGRIDAPERRVVRTIARLGTAFDLIVRGGPYYSWRVAARAFYSIIRDEFRPDLCFATIGNLETLNIGRELARQCGVPWVLDIKDSADVFLTSFLRPLHASRYWSAAAVTLNSEHQRRHNAGWRVAEAPVIYSGAEFDALAGTAAFDPNVFSLVGAISSAESLTVFLKTFKAFAETRGSSGPRPVINYYGRETERVRAIAMDLRLGDLLNHVGHVPRTTLLDCCANSAAICYITSQAVFHHKLFEMGALGRPLIAFPPESEEARRLSALHDLALINCHDQSDLLAAFASASTTPTKALDGLQDRIGWPAMTRLLEAVFLDVVSRALKRPSHVQRKAATE